MSAGKESSRWEGNPTFKTDLPCPWCGTRMVLGYYLLTPDDGQHQHTYYVCLAWARDEPRCGWGGWTVPDTPAMTAPDLSPDEAALVALFELSGDFDPCPDCGDDPEDSRLHATGCRRGGPRGSRLRFGPPWVPWVLQP